MDESRDDIRRAAALLGFDVIELPDAAARSAEDAIRFLVNHLDSKGQLEPGTAEITVNAVLHREQLGSTGIGRSIAMPQACVPAAVKTPAGIVAHSRIGIPWHSEDGVPVQWIVLYVTHHGLNVEQMEALSPLFGQLRQQRQ